MGSSLCRGTGRTEAGVWDRSWDRDRVRSYGKDRGKSRSWARTRGVSRRRVKGYVTGQGHGSWVAKEESVVAGTGIGEGHGLGLEQKHSHEVRA